MPISDKCEKLVEITEQPWNRRRCSFAHHFKIIVEGKERHVCGIHYHQHVWGRGLHKYDFEEPPQPSSAI